MANLSGDDRGQLILVAAFAIAVIFVSMALVVNSAIFTENLASRGETAGSEGALSMRAMVETNAGELVGTVNRQADTSDSALDAAIDDAVTNLSVQTSRQQARSGRVVDVSVSSTTEGVRLVQTNNTTFQSSDGDTSYTVADDVERLDGGNGTRAFRLDATVIDATTNASAFEIMVNDSGADGNEDSWRARIYQPTPGVVHVRTLRNDSTTTETADCEVTVDSAAVRIDVTGATIDGEHCSALATAPSGTNFRFGSGTGAGPSDPYDIHFRNADRITGNFSLVVHDTSTLSTPSLDLVATSQPYEVNALYGVTLRYTYATNDLRYETDVRVAPGESDG